MRIDNAINDVQAQTESVTAAIRMIHQDIEKLVKEIDYISEVSMKSSSDVQSVAASSEEQNAAMEEVAAASTHLAKWRLTYKNRFKHLNTNNNSPYASLLKRDSLGFCVSLHIEVVSRIEEFMLRKSKKKRGLNLSISSDKSIGRKLKR